MKFRYEVLRVLPVVMLACSLLPAPARAQFSQQGPKLVGTGAAVTTEQGWSVSLSSDGNTAIVGVGCYNSCVGAAWVYTRSGEVWSQQAKLVGTGADGAAGQGWSVSLSGDGNTAIVGGAEDNNQVGAAWVFTRSGGVWSQQGPKLVGTGAVGAARQGSSVSLSGDGDTAIVGGFFDNPVGAAWVYTRSGEVWSQQAKLVGTGAAVTAAQGWSVSLSGDGNTAIVGGVCDNSCVGAAWVFTRSGEVWSQQGPKLVGTGVVGPTAGQGISVSLSADGNTAIVGGPYDGGFGAMGGGIGAAWVFTRSGEVWSQQGPKLVGTGVVGAAHQGDSVSLSGDAKTAIVGGHCDNSCVGAAWVFAQSVFAGTPGYSNYHGQSVSALARQYKGLNAAAADLGYPDASSLQNAIMAFCGG